MDHSKKELLLRIPLEKILPNPQQPRQHFNTESIKGLADSMKVQGVIQPLVVRKAKDRIGFFELVAGERRWRALQLTEIVEIPCLLKEIADENILEMALIENIQREDLTPIEEAKSYEKLIQQHQFTQEALGQRLGKNRSTVANMLRLLQLPSAIQNDLEEGRLTVGHARPLLALPSQEEQLKMREAILRNEWSVRETEKQIRDLLPPSRTEAPPPSNSAGGVKRTKKELDVELKHLEEELQRQLGTKVTLTYNQGRGSITLEYYSLEEFERLQQVLMK